VSFDKEKPGTLTFDNAETGNCLTFFLKQRIAKLRLFLKQFFRVISVIETYVYGRFM